MQHRAKKRLGQNFLVDPNIIRHIVESINPQAEDRVIEIGPGLGAITKPLLERLNKLEVIEFDDDVIPDLIKTCAPVGQPVIHKMDVLKFDFTLFMNESPTTNKLRIVGNLPYNISTAVLFHLLKHRSVIEDMHFMLQKEVVERIIAPSGQRDYGRLSVMLQTYFKVTALFTVSAQCFRPIPKVESAILRLVPDNKHSNQIKNPDQFEDLVRQAFSQRRKTLRNTLKKLCTPEQILAANIDPSQRAETLQVEDFLRLHQLIS